MKITFALTLTAALLLTGFVARADDFFVANFGVNSITKYDATGNGSSFTDAFVNGPNGVAVDASGNLYVSTNQNTIEKFAPNGNDLGLFASTGLNNALGLAFDHAGNLYAANFAGNTVEKFSPSGADLGVFASVIRPTGIAFDTAGNLYVANFGNTIERFGPNGTPLGSFANTGLNNPEGLVFDSLGKLYAANNGSNTIEVYSSAGVDLGPLPVPSAGSTSSQSGEFIGKQTGGRHIYIAYRTDGIAGDGTVRNPFDGSSQSKLDGIFKPFYDVGATDITFHLAAGTYQMKGAWDYDWAMLTGWHVKGAGRDLTIIQQVAGTAGVNPGSNGALFGNGWALNYDNQSVEDLTCDCAWFRSGPGGDNSRPHGNFQGINLYGSNPLIRNVTVTGCGWQDNECFAILTSGGVNDLNLPDNALYENVNVSNGGTGIYSTHLTGMAMINLAAMGNDPTPVYAKNGRIINCTFDLPEAGNAGGMPAGYDGGIVTGCTFIGYWHGMFHDTFVSKNITIVGNTIKALYVGGNGILFNSGVANTPCENIAIVGNTLFSAGGIDFASAVKNSPIIGNRIRRAPGSNSDYSIFLDTGTVQDIRVFQNTVDPGIPYLSRDTADCWFGVNRTPAGTLSIPKSPTTPNDSAGVSYSAISAPETAGLSGPIGLAIDSADNLYVVNSLSATIEKITPDGTATIFAPTGFNPAFIAVQKTPKLLNISTRALVLTDDKVLDAGFIVSGSGTVNVLIRGLGPSLGSAGVTGALADPVLEVHDNTGALIASNDNWQQTQQAAIQATGLAPTSNAEAAVLLSLTAGQYTVVEHGSNLGTGVGLVEVYNLSAGLNPELANISTRGFVGTGSEVMIAGFIMGGSAGGSSEVVIRGLGPSLGAAGVANPLGDPVLELHDSNGSVVATNDNWQTTQSTELQASGLAPNDSAEAAILATLAPGPYTAIESGKNGGTGVGLIEVYNLE